MAKRITMLKTAAGPDFVFLQGHSYKVSDELFEAFTSDNACCLADDDAKLDRVPPQPDPEDTGKEEEDDEPDYGEEDDDE